MFYRFLFIEHFKGADLSGLSVTDKEELEETGSPGPERNIESTRTCVFIALNGYICSNLLNAKINNIHMWESFFLY